MTTITITIIDETDEYDVDWDSDEHPHAVADILNVISGHMSEHSDTVYRAMHDAAKATLQ